MYFTVSVSEDFEKVFAMKKEVSFPPPPGSVTSDFSGIDKLNLEVAADSKRNLNVRRNFQCFKIKSVLSLNQYYNLWFYCI